LECRTLLFLLGGTVPGIREERGDVGIAKSTANVGDAGSKEPFCRSCRDWVISKCSVVFGNDAEMAMCCEAGSLAYFWGVARLMLEQQGVI
jgi:hypothetical protein